MKCKVWVACVFILSYRIAVDFISKKKESITQTKSAESDTKSLLELYLSSEELDMKDVIGMAVDMLLAGIDTVRSY
jgi:ecdysteroid 25-hydroxylase CYP302A1